MSLRAPRLAALLLLARALAAGQPLGEKIDAVIQSSVTGRPGIWGVHIVELTKGNTVYAFQPDRFFVPASTAKLFSTAMALERLGPDHRFQTTIAASSEPDASGRVHGDLRLVGGGDPTLSGRTYPYRKDAPAGNPLRAIEELADQVVARGVRIVSGDIVGDDTKYWWEPYPAGRAQEDFLWDYGAPVSALTVNDNRISLIVRPGKRAAAPADVRLSPSVEYFVVENRALTAAAGGRSAIQVARSPGSRQLRVWGPIPLGAAAEGRSLAVDDPALFAAMALRDALGRRGVQIAGKAVARHRYPGETAGPGNGAPGGREIARRLSPPLRQILAAVNKESLNLHAELLLQEVGRIRGADGTRAAGLGELERFLGENGVPANEVNLVDASGLSVLDLVTPRAMTALLARMDRSENREVWIESLAVAGEEGTLSQRFAGAPAARRIRAKTGTLSHVSAIAGYAETAGGERLAFALLVNNFIAPSSEVRAITDRICLLMVQ